MKKLFVILILLAPSSEALFAQRANLGEVARLANQVGKQGNRANAQRQPQQLRPDRSGNNRQPIQNVVEGFYVSRFQEMVPVGDEQFVKILPVLRQTFRELREISMRKRRALTQLNQMTAREEPEENLKRMIREVDAADQNYFGVLERLYSSVDPHLTPQQQARFRIFQDRIDQQIRQMINQVNAAAPPPGD